MPYPCNCSMLILFLILPPNTYYQESKYNLILSNITLLIDILLKTVISSQKTTYSMLLIPIIPDNTI